VGQLATTDYEPPRVRSPAATSRERYSALGIVREDWEARMRAAIANWDCFGAPVALFCYIDRNLGLPQWSDLGMLPADGMVAGSQDRRGDRVSPG
jgi:hypothetical protein